MNFRQQEKYLLALIAILIVVICILLYKDISSVSGMNLWGSLVELLLGIIVNIISSAITFIAIYFFIESRDLFASTSNTLKLEKYIQDQLDEVKRSILDYVNKLGPVLGRKSIHRLTSIATSCTGFVGLRALTVAYRFRILELVEIETRKI